MDQQIRLLHAEEIECRVSSISEKGVVLLLYKDARVDQRILDETFGIFGWKRSHQCIDGNLYCTVEVFDIESGEWIAKQDVGTVGNYEKEKSQASDSFKRACVNWGIGRELYSAPFIWIPSANAEIKKKDGKLYCNDHFSVSSITYSADREIIALSITNDSQNGKEAYKFQPKSTQDKPAKVAEKAEKGTIGSPKDAITSRQLQTLETELQRTGVNMDTVKDRYGFKEPRNMSPELYDRVMRALAKTKSAGSAA